MNQLLEANKILPVVSIENPDHAIPLAQALNEGGISAIEVTFRTERAAEAIEEIRKNLTGVTVAAGTVLTPEQARQAIAAGAQFGLSPGFDPTIIEMFREANIPFIPGVATPTDLTQAMAMNCQYLKFFPAEALGGLKALKSISAPFRSFGFRFCPTGGVTPGNLGDYLALPDVFAVGGTWIAPADLIKQENWPEITRRAAEAIHLLNSPKGEKTPFIRTVLGDIEPDQLGVCYAHEHIIIDESVATLRYPDFKLESVENGTAELTQFYADGGRAMVDSMPCDAGRNVMKLAAISKSSGVHILCPTGLHLVKYYDDGHWSQHYTAGQITQLFLADIEQGIDRFDYTGPVVERTKHRAGLIKVATGGETLTPRGEKIFEAASNAHKLTGCPILTHVEQGIGAIQQVETFASHDVNLSKVVLSHTDRKPDLAYHRDILQTGVKLEYDSAFRWKTEGNPTLDLVMELIAEFPDQIMLGMDAARPTYWKSYGGEPGLSFLLKQFSQKMRDRGLTDEQWQRIFVSTPAQTYSFEPPIS
ncbi:MAG: bifunctional 4-hydroxy-2-oxoglutarate aldolase/2-dehydro-3-deoxy-phosphogluconate aldolase [Verrucomicrobiota bacterium]